MQWPSEKEQRHKERSTTTMKKSNDRATRTLLQNGGELVCPEE